MRPGEREFPAAKTGPGTWLPWGCFRARCPVVCLSERAWISTVGKWTVWGCEETMREDDPDWNENEEEAAERAVHHALGEVVPLVEVPDLERDEGDPED